MTERRWSSVRLLAVLAVGVVLGAVLTLVIQDRGAADPDPTPEAAPGPSLPEPDAASPPTLQVLLAWQVDPLPPELAGVVAQVDGVERTTAVPHATVGLVGADVDGQPRPGPPDGQVVPMDLIAVDPAGYPAFVPADVASSFASLGSRDLVLGRSSAELRGVGVGAVVRIQPLWVGFGPTITFRVVAVVDDELIGGAEAAVSTDAGYELRLVADRYLLVAHHGDRTAIEDAVRRSVVGPVRFRGPGETPYLRDGDAVLPQVVVKATFGEFTLPAAGGGQDQAWVDANVVDEELPVLGRVRCHRAVIDDLRAAMEQIERERLSHFVDPTPSSGACVSASVIERTGGLSRGYWGIAVFLNSSKNPSGSGSVQEPRIVEILQDHGFTWGGDFLVPEPGYFEFVGTLGR